MNVYFFLLLTLQPICYDNFKNRNFPKNLQKLLIILPAHQNEFSKKSLICLKNYVEYKKFLPNYKKHISKRKMIENGQNTLIYTHNTSTSSAEIFFHVKKKLVTKLYFYWEQKIETKKQVQFVQILISVSIIVCCSSARYSVTARRTFFQVRVRRTFAPKRVRTYGTYKAYIYFIFAVEKKSCQKICGVIA